MFWQLRVKGAVLGEGVDVSAAAAGDEVGPLLGALVRLPQGGEARELADLVAGEGDDGLGEVGVADGALAGLQVLGLGGELPRLGFELVRLPRPELPAEGGDLLG